MDLPSETFVDRDGMTWSRSGTYNSENRITWERRVTDPVDRDWVDLSVSGIIGTEADGEWSWSAHHSRSGWCRLTGDLTIIGQAMEAANAAVYVVREVYEDAPDKSAKSFPNLRSRFDRKTNDMFVTPARFYQERLQKSFER